MEAQSRTSISKEFLSSLPVATGVYLMKDGEGTVIYVGKAKNLRTRVRSYFSGADSRYNVQFLLKRIVSIDTVVVDNERQAIVLEADLIRKYKPRYNIRLKDDKAHPIIRINMASEWPRLELVRAEYEDRARYIGPFAYSSELYGLLDVIKRTLPLRTCSDRILNNRIRPCLEYQIKRCSGPCCLEVDKQIYQGWLEDAVAILEGKNDVVAADFEARMEKASSEMRFEDAAFFRDRLKILKKAQQEYLPVEYPGGAKDAFGIYREGEELEISVVMVRRGRLFEAKSYSFTEITAPDEEALSSFLTQYYAGDKEVPEEVLLPLDIEVRESQEDILSEKRGSKVHILVPKRGAKAKLTALAHKNALENSSSAFAESRRYDEAAKQIQLDFNLEEIPRTIECVDVSHFQGTGTVGSLVVFKDGIADKERYRHFHLSQEGLPDDFASIKELVSRHLSRAADENSISDLMVVDGGKGQLNAALSARKELSLRQPPMIGLAKARFSGGSYRQGGEKDAKEVPERIFLEGANESIPLKANSQGLFLLERLRDEAHRFAITFHRKTRTGSAFKSSLEEIQGVGPKRRKELLKVFGSVQAIRNARPEEISDACGITAKLALRIIEELKKRK